MNLPVDLAAPTLRLFPSSLMSQAFFGTSPPTPTAPTYGFLFVCLFCFGFFFEFFNKQKTKGGHVAVISVWDFCLFILCSSSRHLMVYRACLHCLQWERERACSGTLLELSNCKAQSRPNRQSASRTARDWSGKKPNTNGLV